MVVLATSAGGGYDVLPCCQYNTSAAIARTGSLLDSSRQVPRISTHTQTNTIYTHTHTHTHTQEHSTAMSLHALQYMCSTTCAAQLHADMTHTSTCAAQATQYAQLHSMYNITAAATLHTVRRRNSPTKSSSPIHTHAHAPTHPPTTHTHVSIEMSCTRITQACNRHHVTRYVGC